MKCKNNFFTLKQLILTLLVVSSSIHAEDYVAVTDPNENNTNTSTTTNTETVNTTTDTTTPNVITPDPGENNSSTTTSTTATTTTVAKPVIELVPRIKAANPENQEYVDRIRENLIAKRQSIQKLGERGLLTADEMSELGDELNSLISNLQSIAKNKEKLTREEKRSLLPELKGFRNKRIAKQFNNSFDNGMSQERLAKIQKKQTKNVRTAYKKFRKNKKISAEARSSVSEIQAEMNQVISEANSNGTINDAATRQKLGRLRADFNLAMKRAENEAMKASSTEESSDQATVGAGGQRRFPASTQ